MKQVISLNGRQIYLYGDAGAEYCVVQPVDKRMAESLDAEFAEIEKQLFGRKILLAGVEVEDWNKELSPWEAKGVSCGGDFAGRAGETLTFLTDLVLPRLRAEYGELQFFLAGYSLAGFFSLWASALTDRFAGVAAVSPSVWFPGWLEYGAAHLPKVEVVYLSLGKREEKARNPLLATVGTAIRRQYDLLRENGYGCVLEWNPGNHFKDCEIRTARGIVWVVREIFNLHCNH